MFGGTRKRIIDTGKQTQFSDAWLVLAVLLSLIAIIFDSSYVLFVALSLLVLTALSWLWARYSLYGVTYRRRYSETRAFQGETIELILEVENRKFLPLTWLNITDVFPNELPVVGREIIANPTTNQSEFSTFWMLGPFRRLTRRFDITCSTRGFHRYGPVTLTTGDGFGFFQRAEHDESEERLIVYPRLYSAADLRLPAKNPFGEVRAHGSLFEDPLRTVGVREWRTSDSQRRVHWKATASKQELLSRVYEPSEETQLQFFLNVTTLERHWHGYLPELQERTISVAGSLAALASEQRLPLGLIANGALPGSDQPIRLLPGRNPGHLVRILELLAAVTPFATQPIEQLLLQEAPRMPWGATIVLITAIAHEKLLATLLDLELAGRKLVLFTLAEEPPQLIMEKVTVYHLPHLVDDLIAPILIQD